MLRTKLEGIYNNEMQARISNLFHRAPNTRPQCRDAQLVASAFS